MKNHWPWANNPEQLNPFELQKLEQDGLDIIDEIIHIYSKHSINFSLIWLILSTATVWILF